MGALAVLFDVVSKDCQEISGLLQQLYKGTVSTKEKSVLGKRTRRKNVKNYWTHDELNQIESFLKKHITGGGNSENVDVDQICAAVPTRSKKDVTKQLDLYKRATTDNFRDLSFFKTDKTQKVQVKDEPIDDMDVDAPAKSTPKKKARKSSTPSTPTTPKTTKKKRKSSGTPAASQEESSQKKEGKRKSSRA